MLTNGETYFNASTGNDNLNGNDLDNILLGGVGNDYLAGAKGDDVLFGGEGQDNLHGESGNDTLIGGDGNDTMNGGTGNDTYRFEGAFGQDLITNVDSGKNRHDVVQFTDLHREDMRIHRRGNDLVMENTDGSKRVTVQRHFENHGDNHFHINEVRFADEIVLDIEALKAAVQQGTNGNDHLFAYAHGTTLDGGAGNDTLHGDKGDDIFAGGDGNDQLYGNDGNDTLAGGADNDQLQGGAGNDTLDGGSGNDTLHGQEGNDTYRFASGFGQDRIYNLDSGTNRHDSIHFSEHTLSQIRISRLRDNLIIQTRDGQNQITVDQHFRDEASSAHRIDSIRFADGSILDKPAINRLAQQGSDGHDYLYADLAGSKLDGGAGNDRLHGASGNDTLQGGSGDDHLQGLEGNDTLDGGAGRDNLTGGKGDDKLHGGNDNDWLYGNEGNDILDGGTGMDVLYGNQGADKFIIHVQHPEKILDTIGDFSRADGDKIILADLLPGTLPQDWFAAKGDTHSASTRIYQQNSTLYVDPDGTGSEAPRHFATLTNHAVLQKEDFAFIA